MSHRGGYLSRALYCPVFRPCAEVRLFCFPYAGGAAHVFRDWGDLAGDTIEVYAITLPGHGTRVRERPIEAIDRLAEELADELVPFLDKPYCLFGHSMGAALAYEVTRCLRARGHVEPLALVVSAARAPHLLDVDNPIHHLPDAEFIEGIRAWGATPEEVLAAPEMLELILPGLRADFAACETYEHVPGLPLTSPIAAWGGTEDRHVTPEQLTAWEDYTASRFTLRRLDGGHFFIHDHAATVVASLREEICAFPMWSG